MWNTISEERQTEFRREASARRLARIARSGQLSRWNVLRLTIQQWGERWLRLRRPVTVRPKPHPQEMYPCVEA